MTVSLRRYTRELVVRCGWSPGTSLEDRVALLLSNLGVQPADLVQQHRVGKFRLDFADPDVLIALEADGWHHRMPGKAEQDAERDAWLLGQGWFTIRISDDCTEDEFRRQVAGAVAMIRSERDRQGLRTHRLAGTRRKPYMSSYAAELRLVAWRKQRAEAKRTSQ